MIIDPIADMLTRIRNAGMANNKEAIIPFSKIKWQILQLLKKEGYIANVEKVQDVFPSIKVEIKYHENNKPFIRRIDRISKPGRRVYKGYKNLPIVLNGLGLAVISTSHGIMTNNEARKKKIGGEVLCEIE